MVENLQEPPAGKPWVSERVRTWQPAPLDAKEYEAFAKKEALRRSAGQILHEARQSLRILDPGLFT